ncbi:YbfB/YjiJ family MFS transporter [Nonomuraea sp. FMUSA5-5]|uniref:YbfB/YjiJ family MFS transporter n=2 Tax=Nonomuraea composti TaxID=2720023 RepID=A0ABX1BLB2_9ACTN|nr:YbfB/YjiJ family MFS transporter [Nonomuraea sp. FMUSA5-5]
MGVGRFAYTPILPLMQTQNGLTAAAGANLATANYAGYLIGALAGTLLPALARSTAVLRAGLLALVASLAAMPLTHEVAVWALLRLAAGVSSALIFVIAVNSLHSHLHAHPAHLPGWGFGGVGAGIALSGALILLLRESGSWQTAWTASAALAAVLTLPAWPLHPDPPPPPPPPTASPGPPPVSCGRVREAGPSRTGEQEAGTSAPRRTEREAGSRPYRSFGALFASYTLEGVGYIVAGTFLVAAIEQSAPGWIGSGAWVLVGLAAVPSAALWAGPARRWSRPALLVAALTVQAVGIALPALTAGVAPTLIPALIPALISAVLFGGTFIGVSTLALGAGAHLRFPRAVALLTAGYSAGQILGPLAVTPLLRDGYRQALVLAAAVVLTAALAALVLRRGYPDQPGVTVRDARRAAPARPRARR